MFGRDIPRLDERTGGDVQRAPEEPRQPAQRARAPQLARRDRSGHAARRARAVSLLVVVGVALAACTGGTAPARPGATATERATATASPVGLESEPPVAPADLPDGAEVPTLPAGEPLSPARQAELRQGDVAAREASRLLAEAGRPGEAGLRGTLALLQEVGFSVRPDLGGAGTEPDQLPPLVVARQPWVQGSALRAGQAVGLARMLQQRQTVDLREFLTFAHRATGIEVPDRLPVRPLAQGLLDELQSPAENPLFVAVLSGAAGGGDLRGALTELAAGSPVAAVGRVDLSGAQYVFLLLRLRKEFVGAMQEIVRSVDPPQSSPNAAGPGVAPAAFAPATSQKQLCRPDDPWNDSTVSLVSDAFGAKVVDRLLEVGYIKKLFAEAQDAASVSHLLTSANMWSSLLNLAMLRAFTQLTIGQDPLPVVRTRASGRDGEQGRLRFHGEVSNVPGSRYVNCLQVLAGVGLTLPNARNAPIANSVVSWRFVGGQHLIKFDDHPRPEDRASSTTNGSGDAGADVLGRRQSPAKPDSAVAVRRTATVVASVNPDTAQDWYQTTWAAFADATSLFLALIGKGTISAPKPDPVAVIDEVIAPLTRALNYFGWLRETAPIQVRDWGEGATLSFALRLARASYYCCSYVSTSDATFDVEGDVPLSIGSQAPVHRTASAYVSDLLGATNLVDVCKVAENSTPPTCNVSTVLQSAAPGTISVADVVETPTGLEVTVRLSGLAETVRSSCTGNCGWSTTTAQQESAMDILGSLADRTTYDDRFRVTAQLELTGWEQVRDERGDLQTATLVRVRDRGDYVLEERWTVDMQR